LARVAHHSGLHLFFLLFFFFTPSPTPNPKILLLGLLRAIGLE
jgi:hypothetical protein